MLAKAVQSPFLHLKEACERQKRGERTDQDADHEQPFEHRSALYPFPSPAPLYCKNTKNMVLYTHMKKHTHFQQFTAGFVLASMYFVYMFVILPSL